MDEEFVSDAEAKVIAADQPIESLGIVILPLAIADPYPWFFTDWTLPAATRDMAEVTTFCAGAGANINSQRRYEFCIPGNVNQPPRFEEPGTRADDGSMHIPVLVGLGYRGVQPDSGLSKHFFVTVEAAPRTHGELSSFAKAWRIGHVEPTWPSSSLAEFVGLPSPPPKIEGDDEVTGDKGDRERKQAWRGGGPVSAYLEQSCEAAFGEYAGNPGFMVPRLPIVVLGVARESAEGVDFSGSDFRVDVSPDWFADRRVIWDGTATPTNLLTEEEALRLLDASSRGEYPKADDDVPGDLAAVLSVAVQGRVPLERLRQRLSKSYGFWTRGRDLVDSSRQGGRPHGDTSFEDDALDLLASINGFRLEESTPDEVEVDPALIPPVPEPHEHAGGLSASHALAWQVLVGWKDRHPPWTDVAAEVNQLFSSWAQTSIARADRRRELAGQRTASFLRVGAAVVALAAIVAIAIGLAAIPKDNDRLFTQLTQAAAITILLGLGLGLLAWIGQMVLEKDSPARRSPWWWLFALLLAVCVGCATVALRRLNEWDWVVTAVLVSIAFASVVGAVLIRLYLHDPEGRTP